MMQFATPDDYHVLGRRTITGLPLERQPVELKGGRLSFAEKRIDVVEVRPTLLWSFLRLRAAQDRQVLQFAKRWGRLNLCEHGQPVDLCRAQPRCQDAPYDHVANGWIERTEHWRAWSDRFEAMLRLCRQLDETPAGTWDRKTVVRAFDGFPWAVEADAWYPPAIDQRESKRSWTPPTLAYRRAHLAHTLNWLLWGSRVRREVAVVRRGAWAITDGSRWLMGALVLQLTHACVNVASHAICVECQKSFEPDRRTAKYCARCRTAGVRQKRAQQARRARLIARGLTSRGNRPRGRSTTVEVRSAPTRG